MQDPTKPLRFVSVTDPALDWQRMDVHDYAQSRDPDKVVTIPGSRPTWWEVRPLDADQWVSVEEAGGVATRRLVQSVMFALVAIDRGDGTAWRPTRIVQAIGGELVICSQADIQHLFGEYGGNRLREVGCVIYERAEVGKAQSGAALFTVPPSLLAELDRIGRQHAARILAESKTGTTQNS